MTPIETGAFITAIVMFCLMIVGIVMSIVTSETSTPIEMIGWIGLCVAPFLILLGCIVKLTERPIRILPEFLTRKKSVPESKFLTRQTSFPEF
jgi:hypothetical protein